MIWCFLLAADLVLSVPLKPAHVTSHPDFQSLWVYHSNDAVVYRVDGSGSVLDVIDPSSDDLVDSIQRLGDRLYLHFDDRTAVWTVDGTFLRKFVRPPGYANLVLGRTGWLGYGGDEPYAFHFWDQGFIARHPVMNLHPGYHGYSEQPLYPHLRVNQTGEWAIFVDALDGWIIFFDFQDQVIDLVRYEQPISEILIDPWDRVIIYGKTQRPEDTLVFDLRFCHAEVAWIWEPVANPAAYRRVLGRIGEKLVVSVFDELGVGFELVPADELGSFLVERPFDE